MRHGVSAPKNTAEYLDYVRLYDDGLCELRDGLWSKTLKISDINYQTARKDEKLDVLGRYAEVLNSIDPLCHAQITAINRKVDEAQFRSTMFLRASGDAYDSYRAEMNDMLSDKALEGQNGVLREKFITITAPAASYGEGRALLARLETEYAGHFKSLGCDVAVLSGLQRLELLHHYTRNGEPFLFDYEQLLYSNLTTKHFIAPMCLDFSDKRTVQVGDEYGETLVLRDLPTRLNDQLITRISELPFDLTVTVHIDRVEQAEALELLQSKISFMEMEQSDKESKALEKGRNPKYSVPAETRRKYGGALELLRELEENDQRLFRVTVLVYTRASSREELRKQVAQIASVCAQRSCQLTPLDNRQREGFNSTLPLGLNSVNVHRTLLTKSTAIFIPFTTQELYRPGGIYYGLNALSHNLIFFSRYDLKAGNGFITGSTGSGKSFAAKREMISVLMMDPTAEVIVIDPEREYTTVAQRFDGEVIHISAGSRSYLNPMDITDDYADDDDPLLLKSEFILTLVEMICGGRQGLTAGERSVVSRACALCYRKYFASLGRGELPTLKDFYAILREQPEPEAQNMALALELYIEGTLSVFAHHTNVDTSKRFIVYDVRDLGKQLRTLGMLIVLDQIWNRITRNRARGIRTWVYIDEIQLLFSNEFCAQTFFEFWSRARKWGALFTGITQNVETLLMSDLARRMLSNSDFIMLLNQAAADRIELAGLLHMSNKQLGYVTNAAVGSGLLIAGKSLVPFMDDFPHDTELYRMMSTKPNEELKNEAAEAQR